MSDIAKFLVDQGVDKSYLVSLYRGENFYNQQKIVRLLNNRFKRSDITRTHLKELFVKYGISVWTISEQRHAQNVNPISSRSVKARQERLLEVGFTVQDLEDMYKAGMSKAAIIKYVNKKAAKNVLNKVSIKHLWEYYGLFVRDKDTDNKIRMAQINNVKAEKVRYKENLSRITTEQVINLYRKGYSPKVIADLFETDSATIQSLVPDAIKDDMKKNNDRTTEKMYGIGITKQEAIEIYQTKKLSLSKMYQEYGISPVVLSRVLKDEGISVKTQRNVTDLLETLQDLGVDKELIVQKYHVENCTQNEMIEWINSYLDGELPVTNRTFEKIVKILDIRKDSKQRVETQGRKSRAELIANLDKLKKAGFDSREELAKFYENNHSLTKQQLVKDLNTAIDEDFFTIRWLERHLDPFLSEDRLKGVSRAEKEFQNKVEQLLPNVAMEFNDWKTIAPYQLDIYIPSLCVAIEFNGNYWHSDKFLKANHNMTAKDYHTMKKLMCQDKQIDLLYVWEYDWYEDSEAILTALEKFFKTGKNSEILSKLEY